MHFIGGSLQVSVSPLFLHYRHLPKNQFGNDILKEKVLISDICRCIEGLKMQF